MGNQDIEGSQQPNDEEVKRRPSIELTRIDPSDVRTNPRDSNLSNEPSKAAYQKPEEISSPEKIGGYMGFLKYSLIAFNTIIWLLGLVITAISIWLLVDPALGTFQLNVDMAHLKTASYIGIALGVFIMTVGCIGCCGAIKESLCLLAIFLTIGIIFVILDAAAMAVAWSAITNKDTQDKIAYLINKSIGNRKESNSARYFIDLLQERLQCCGIQAPNEYSDDRMPKSCLDPNSGKVFEKSCVESMTEYLKSKAAIFGSVAVVTLLIQIGAIATTICLICAIRQAAEPIF